MAKRSSGRTKQNMKETDNFDDDDGSSAGEEEEDDDDRVDTEGEEEQVLEHDEDDEDDDEDDDDDSEWESRARLATPTCTAASPHHPHSALTLAESIGNAEMVALVRQYIEWGY